MKNEVDCKFPSIIGSVVLDISKLHMYKSWYKGLKPNISDLQLLYHDTDSFVMYSRSPNFWQEMALLKESLLDCSNLPNDHPLAGEPTNKGVLGMLKDETEGKEISEAIFLRPKMYSIEKVDKSSIRKAKGVRRYIVEKQLRHQRYLNILTNSTEESCTQRGIQPRNFINYTVETKKRSLSCFCDKRRQLDEIYSTPYGYKGPDPVKYLCIDDADDEPSRKRIRLR